MRPGTAHLARLARSAPWRLLDRRDRARLLLPSLCRVLDARSVGPVRGGRGATPDRWAGRRRRPLAPAVLAELDAATLAAGLTGLFGRTYRTAVLGPATAAVGHLAAIMDAPWLPTGLRFTARGTGDEPDPDRVSAALRSGGRLVPDLLARNPGILVHQVHDPIYQRAVAATGGLDLRLHWRTLPPAYQRFLDERIAPDGPVVLVHDRTSWPVVRLSDRHVFQLGRPGGLTSIEYYQGGARSERLLSAAGGPLRLRDVPAPDENGTEATEGVTADFVLSVYEWARERGRTIWLVPTSAAGDLAATVADTYRCWLRQHGRLGNRLLVECGHLFDLWHVLRAGLVPYWCPGPFEPRLDALELWLAGCEQFDDIHLLPEPRHSGPGAVPAERWEAVGAFAGRSSRWPRPARRRYPGRPVAARYPDATLRRLPYDAPLPAPLGTDVFASVPAFGARQVPTGS